MRDLWVPISHWVTRSLGQMALGQVVTGSRGTGSHGRGSHDTGSDGRGSHGTGSHRRNSVVHRIISSLLLTDISKSRIQQKL